VLVDDLYRPAFGAFKELRFFRTNFSNDLTRWGNGPAAAQAARSLQRD
jgi:hypothetical protein